MSDSVFDPTYRDLLVSRMDRLMAMLVERGLTQSYLNSVTRGDRSWTRDYRKRDTRVGTYDMVFAKLSAIWPEDLPWPEDIPRHVPAEIGHPPADLPPKEMAEAMAKMITPDVLADVRAKLAKTAPNKETANG